MNFLQVPTEEILYDDGKEQQRYFRVTGRRGEDFRIIEQPEITVKETDIGKHHRRYLSIPKKYIDDENLSA